MAVAAAKEEDRQTNLQGLEAGTRTSGLAGTRASVTKQTQGKSKRKTKGTAKVTGCGTCQAGSERHRLWQRLWQRL